ncbi:peroxin [Malassezia brasiliensis]|uniref:Peroxin n=1 Tax=Malassezia brasiliensis TaxID=1821822 RepID=A0AAF0DVC5_9BASI|nr:peroxin [Malassezia brasiliensis]
MAPGPASRRTWLRRGLNVVAITTGLVGGLYMLAQFTLNKLNEIQERFLRDRVARENLRRRFLQNQEDCTFTIMALLPTLSTQIFQEMDVEATRQELKQVIDSAKEAPKIAAAPAPAPAEEPVRAAHTTHTIGGGKASDAASRGGNSAASAPPKGGLDRLSEAPPPPISSEARLPPPSAAQQDDAVSPAPAPAPPAPSDEDRRQAKVRLWNEIKLQSFSRTFTTLYTLVFLALQTHIQLNMIGRRAYLAALESQAEHKFRDTQTDLSETEKHHIELHDASDLHISQQLLSDDEEAVGNALLDQDTEKKYLTSSYWFLHHGWKAIAARVQQAVQAEIGEMPLRTILTYHHFQGAMDRIRERLEGSDAQAPSEAFLSKHGFRNLLLPERMEDECAMLANAGAILPNTPSDEVLTPQLRSLLDETKDYIDSPDFARVFRVSCDRVFDLLMQHLAPSFGVQSTPDDLLHGTADARHRARVLAAEKPLELARVLPLVALQAQVAFNTSPNEYVEAITESRELRAFSVLMYTAWGSDVTP